MMLGDSDHQKLPAFENSSIQTQAGVRIVWRNLLEMVVDAGSFIARAIGGNLEELIKTSCELFPSGPPMGGHRWKLSFGYHVSEYVDFVRTLFPKTLVFPISSRWFTVEKGAAYLYIHRCCSIGRRTILPNLDLPYWPGDDITMEEDQEAFAEKKKKG